MTAGLGSDGRRRRTDGHGGRLHHRHRTRPTSDFNRSAHLHAHQRVVGKALRLPSHPRRRPVRTDGRREGVPHGRQTADLRLGRQVPAGEAVGEGHLGGGEVDTRLGQHVSPRQCARRLPSTAAPRDEVVAGKGVAGAGETTPLSAVTAQPSASGEQSDACPTLQEGRASSRPSAGGRRSSPPSAAPPR